MGTVRWLAMPCVAGCGASQRLTNAAADAPVPDLLWCLLRTLLDWLGQLVAMPVEQVIRGRLANRRQDHVDRQLSHAPPGSEQLRCGRLLLGSWWCFLVGLRQPLGDLALHARGGAHDEADLNQEPKLTEKKKHSAALWTWSEVHMTLDSACKLVSKHSSTPTLCPLSP